MRKGFTLIILALIVFPASLWGLAWFFSAYTTAPEHCLGHISLLHQEMLCRKPAMIMLGSVLIGLLSAWIFYQGVKSIRESN
jgi:amino acid transporter